MAITRPIPVRLDDDLIRRLDAAAQRLGTTRAGVIKLCLTAFLDHFESAGGVASLPLNWREMIAANDGRTRRSKESKPIFSDQPTGPLQLNERAAAPATQAPKKRPAKRKSAAS